MRQSKLLVSFAFIVMFLAWLLPLNAQQRIAHSFDFTLTSRNQSVWAPGEGRIDYTYFLGTNFNSSDSYNGYFNFFGETGVAGNASISGQTGLRFSAYADGGSVDIVYPVTLEIQVPERDALVPGGPVVITSALKRNGAATMNTRSPDANVILEAILKAQPSVTMTGKLSGRTLFNGQVLSESLRNLDLKVQFFNLRNYVLPGSSDVSIDIFPTYPNLLRADLHFPIINIQATNNSSSPLMLDMRGKGNDKVITLTGNITAALIYLLQTAVGSPPFNFLDQSISFPPGSPVYTFSGGYSIARAEARGTIGFQQDVELLPKPKIRLERTDGSLIVEGRVGDPLAFTMPTNGSLEIRAKLIFDNEFKNKLSITLGGGLYFIPLEFYASGNIGTFTIGGFSLMPLDPYKLEASIPFQLLERSFTLGGFNQPLTNTVPVEANTSTTPAVFYSVNFPGNTFARFGDTSATLRIEGRPLGYLNSSAQIFVNNIAIPTTYNAAQNLVTATLSRPTHDSILNTLRTDGFPVFVRVPGKPDSNTLNFPVGYKRPLIDQVRQGGILFNTYEINSVNVDLTIEVSSQNRTFSKDLTVIYWNDKPLTTYYPFPGAGNNDFDGGYVTAIVPQDLLQTGGHISLTARTPLPGGGESPSWNIIVAYPPPGFAQNDPVQPTKGHSIGDAGLTLTIQGSKFIKGDSSNTSSVVLFQPNETGPYHELPTTFVSTTKLLAEVPANLLGSAGNARVDVRSPSVSGFQYTGNTKTFVVLNPVGFINRCDPPYLPRGSATSVIKVLGKGFKPFMQVYFNNAPRATTFVSANELRFTVNANEMTTGVVRPVRVASPQPPGEPIRFSNEERFTVYNDRPTISGISPESRFAFGGAFQLDVFGGTFSGNTRVFWNGQERPTTFISVNQVRATIPNTDLLHPGQIEITTQNVPSEFSNAAIFVVTEANTIYVSTTGNDAANGLSWATAKRNIQTAINTATVGRQVWVKAGVYNERLLMRPGIPVFGGFAGNETSRWQRNLISANTVIDAQLGGIAVNFLDGAGSETILDGFTIRNGRSGQGSAIYGVNGSPTVSNNVIINQQNTGTGSTLFFNSGAPKILNNTIVKNNSNRAAVYLEFANGAQIVNNTIAYNTTNHATEGGGIFVGDNSNVLVANNIVAFNSSNNITRKNVGSAQMTLRNNCVTGSPQNYRNIQAGPKDIADDPQFVAPNGDNYHLKATSPCFDAGHSPDALIIPVDTDGFARIFGAEVDMGADEINELSPTNLLMFPHAGYIGQTVTFTAALTQLNTGSALPNQRVTFYVNNQLVAEGLTNVNGTAIGATFIIPQSLGVGNHTLEARFPGFRALAPSVRAGSLNVLRTTTVTTVQNAQGVVGQPVSLFASLTGFNNQPLANKPMAFKVNGALLGTVNTNASGVAEWTVSLPAGIPRGNQTLTAEYAGDANFLPSSQNGTLVVVNSAPTAQLAGAALRFNGSNSIQNAGYGLIAPTTEITIEFWQKVDGPAQQAPLSIGTSNTNRISMHTPWIDGVVYWDFGNIFTGGRLSYTPPQSLSGTWQHFAFVASQSGNFMRIYRNGILEAQKTGPLPYVRGNVPLIIGGNGYAGELDEVRIWNTARTQTQVQQFMNSILQGNETDLMGYWRLDEGSGNTANDSRGTRHATFTGSPQWTASGAPIQIVRKNAPGEMRVPFNGFDPNTDPLTRTMVTPPAPGIMTSLPPAIPMFVPIGLDDDLAYKVNDGLLDSNNAVVQMRTEREPVAGLAGNMIALGGNQGRGTVAHNAVLNTYPLTIECWFKTTSLQDAGIVNKYVSGSLNGYQIYLYQGRLKAWYFRNGSNYIWDGALGIDGGFVADGSWHHAAFVVDAQGGKLYVDGVLRASRNWTGAPGATNTTTPLHFGVYPTTNPAIYFPFRGVIDEVRLWTRARTRAELVRDLRATLRGDEPGLLGYWRFDEQFTTGVFANNSGFGGSVLDAQFTAPFARTGSTAPIEEVHVPRGQSRAFRAGAYEMMGGSLVYSLLSNPTRGQLSGAFPNLTYTPNSGGIDQFDYNARSETFLFSQPATVRIRIVTPGDTNGDGCVNDTDLLTVLFAFGTDDLAADLNADGIVNDSDLLEVLFNFGVGC